MATRAVHAGVWFGGFHSDQRREIDIENLRAVEFDLDRGALHGDFLEIPLAGRARVSAIRRRQPVGRAVVLLRVELSRARLRLELNGG